MKKLILVSAIAMSGLFYQNANAQVHFSLNLGLRPVVVERTPVYDDDYYYLPDVGAYYSVSNRCYYYQDGGAWVSAAYLPGVYRDYDWRTERHFAVNEARPYLHNDVYRARYGGFEGRRDWNYRGERSDRVFADRDRFDHDGYRGREYQRNDQHYDNYRSDHQQWQQQPQNQDRGNFGGRNDHQQQWQQQNNNNHVNDRGNDNNNGNRDNGRQGRGGRF